MDMLTIAISALINGAVVYGVVKTEMKYLRRDTDLANSRIDQIIANRCPSGSKLHQADHQ